MKHYPVAEEVAEDRLLGVVPLEHNLPVAGAVVNRRQMGVAEETQAWCPHFLSMFFVELPRNTPIGMESKSSIKPTTPRARRLCEVYPSRLGAPCLPTPDIVSRRPKPCRSPPWRSRLCPARSKPWQM